ncbi:hypothetical protein BZG36_01980 [Bifiguratus adelaidae]|uniref:NADP-dependent oxidoreductase domain-containing protein n=1 Tax=Bifiguratus adelaidae TaxID=1938954 RepID=A0A261Y442_9FUNG|nr:hypothetical protein BZG36_01980 [Bifiguratus adelaidae]
MNDFTDLGEPHSRVRSALSAVVPKVVMGGAGFSNQLVKDPSTLPARDIIKRAFELGVRAFDTSPYYGDSEVIMGDALSQPGITGAYKRSDYLLMTKAGRIAATEFDYSPEWVRRSVERSLQRLKTPYLDVVFCHDIEYVTEEEAVEAVGVLFELVKEGKVRYAGVSGYPIARLVKVAHLVRERYGRPIDAVQNWAQLTLQNTRLEKEGLPALKAAGVDCVFTSSPLAIGLLRSGGVPVGALGDFHPAPQELRQAVQQASYWVESQGDHLSALATRFTYARMTMAIQANQIGGATIFGGSSIAELEENVLSAKSILESIRGPHMVFGDLRDLQTVNKARFDSDLSLYEGVQGILGSWVDYCFTSPDKGWDVKLKKIITDVQRGTESSTNSRGCAKAKNAKSKLIDSHIHLYDADQLTTLSWMEPSHLLQGQHSLDEYMSAVSGRCPADWDKGPTDKVDVDGDLKERLLGFIFVETDRINDPPSSPSGWKYPLQEYDFVASVSLGTHPRYAAYSPLVLGIVPWAPLPYGVAAMEEYVSRLMALHPGSHGKPHRVVGFRYLLQSEPSGTMLTDDFIASLRWMGQRGFVFECTVDCAGAGTWMLKEAMEMIRRVHAGVTDPAVMTRFVLSHLAKPDCSLTADPSGHHTHAFHEGCVELMTQLSTLQHTAIKLSGCFSQLPKELQVQPAYPATNSIAAQEWIEQVVKVVSPWTNEIFKTLGPQRVIWGSDWPMCNVRGGKAAWKAWVVVTERLLEEAGLSQEEQEDVGWRNAKRIFQLE